MSRATIRLPFGITGTIAYFTAPEGRPSSVTSSAVYPWDEADHADNAVTLLGTAAVETNPNTTVDAASGVGQSDPRIVYVAATTGFIVGVEYRITAADGNSETFEVIEIDSGNYVKARHPLHNAYASADTVQSTRIQATVDATGIADEDNISDTTYTPGYRWRLVYVVAGKTCVWDMYLDVTRYTGQHGVTGIDVDALLPNWLDRLPVDHRADQGKRLIAEAASDVRMDCLAVWRSDHRVADAEVLDTLIKWKAIELGEFARVMSGGVQGAVGVMERYELAKSRYQERFKALVRVPDKIPTRQPDGSARPHYVQGLIRS